ncbi:MAG: hypothetical protein HOP31_08880 [Ignavibacteria bacterium]|nr:hypothetical protein [Ignavibacteria bacterium]
MKFRKSKKINDVFSPSVKLTEALVPGSKYKCDILYAGITATANTFAEVNGAKIPVFKNYTEKACIEAVNNKIFEGVPALLRSEGDHLSAENTGVNSQVGWYSNVTWDSVKKCITGIFNVKNGEGLAESFKQSLAEISSAGKELGLSIVAWGDWIIENIADKCVATVTKITSAQSVDPVAAGNAGGKIIKLVESLNSNLTINLNGDNNVNPELKLKIFALLSSAMLISEGATAESINDDDLLQSFWEYAITLMNSPTLTESTKKSLTEIQPMLDKDKPTKNPILAELLKKEVKPVGTPAPAPATPLTEGQNGTNAILERAEILACGTILRNKLAECNLPQPAKNYLLTQFDKKKFAEADLDTAIAGQQRILAEINPNPINNRGLDMRVGRDAVDRSIAQLTYMLMSHNMKARLTEAEMQEFKDVDKRMFSIKEWYRTFTGDTYVTGRTNGDNGILSESVVTTGFTNALASTLHRLAVAEYKMLPFEDWKKLCSTIGGTTDFRNNERVRWGGYGNLPTVNQAGSYTALTTPTDEKATFAVTKKGGTEDVTLESIKNDDVGLIASIPIRLGRAAKITLYEFVMDMIIGNPTIYDSVALYHATHGGNLLNTALNSTSYLAARNVMKNQTEKDSAKKLGIPPKYLLVANGSDNEKTAYELTTQAWNKANEKSDFHQTFGVEPIVVVHQSNSNNWRLVADPSYTPTIEIGFLDNQQEPEIFTQDMPNVGSLFSNDKITFKIRHIYGGNILDFRGFVGSNP